MPESPSTTLRSRRKAQEASSTSDIKHPVKNLEGQKSTKGEPYYSPQPRRGKKLLMQRVNILLEDAFPQLKEHFDSRISLERFQEYYGFTLAEAVEFNDRARKVFSAEELAEPATIFLLWDRVRLLISQPSINYAFKEAEKSFSSIKERKMRFYSEGKLTLFMLSVIEERKALLLQSLASLYEQFSSSLEPLTGKEINEVVSKFVLVNELCTTVVQCLSKGLVVEIIWMDTFIALYKDFSKLKMKGEHKPKEGEKLLQFFSCSKDLLKCWKTFDRQKRCANLFYLEARRQISNGKFQRIGYTAYYQSKGASNPPPWQNKDAFKSTPRSAPIDMNVKEKAVEIEELRRVASMKSKTSLKEENRSQELMEEDIKERGPHNQQERLMPVHTVNFKEVASLVNQNEGSLKKKIKVKSGHPSKQSMFVKDKEEKKLYVEFTEFHGLASSILRRLKRQSDHIEKQIGYLQGLHPKGTRGINEIKTKQLSLIQDRQENDAETRKLIEKICIDYDIDRNFSIAEVLQMIDKKESPSRVVVNARAVPIENEEHPVEETHEKGVTEDELTGLENDIEEQLTNEKGEEKVDSWGRFLQRKCEDVAVSLGNLFSSSSPPVEEVPFGKNDNEQTKLLAGTGAMDGEQLVEQPSEKDESKISLNNGGNNSVNSKCSSYNAEKQENLQVFEAKSKNPENEKIVAIEREEEKKSVTGIEKSVYNEMPLESILGDGIAQNQAKRSLRFPLNLKEEANTVAAETDVRKEEVALSAHSDGNVGKPEKKESIPTPFKSTTSSRVKDDSIVERATQKNSKKEEPYSNSTSGNVPATVDATNVETSVAGTKKKSSLSVKSKSLSKKDRKAANPKSAGILSLLPAALTGKRNKRKENGSSAESKISANNETTKKSKEEVSVSLPSREESEQKSGGLIIAASSNKDLREKRHHF